MTKEAQMQVNGGAWAHCHSCGTDFWGFTKSMARNSVSKHISKSNGRCRWWDWGQFADCSNI